MTPSTRKKLRVPTALAVVTLAAAANAVATNTGCSDSDSTPTCSAGGGEVVVYTKDGGCYEEPVTTDCA